MEVKGAHEYLADREPEVFSIANPKRSPWPGWEELRVEFNENASLGPQDWVAAFDGRRCYVGKVESMQRSFIIKDVTTGKRVRLGGVRQPYFAKVVGRYSSVEAMKVKPRRAGR